MCHHFYFCKLILLIQKDQTSFLRQILSTFVPRIFVFYYIFFSSVSLQNTKCHSGPKPSYDSFPRFPGIHISNPWPRGRFIAGLIIFFSLCGMAQNNIRFKSRNHYLTNMRNTLITTSHTSTPSSLIFSTPFHLVTTFFNLFYLCYFSLSVSHLIYEILLLTF